MTEKELGAQRRLGHLALRLTEIDKILRKIWLAKESTDAETGLCHCSIPVQYKLVAAFSLDTGEANILPPAYRTEEADVKRIRM